MTPRTPSDEERGAFKLSELNRWYDGECAERVEKAAAPYRDALAALVAAQDALMLGTIDQLPQRSLVLLLKDRDAALADARRLIGEGS